MICDTPEKAAEYWRLHVVDSKSVQTRAVGSIRQ